MDLEIPFQLSHGGESSLSTSTKDSWWSVANGHGHTVYLDTTWFEGDTVNYYFEVVASNSDTSDRDIDIIDSGITTKASVTVTNGTTTETRFARQSFTPNTGADFYGIQLDQTTSGDQLYCYHARIIVVVTGATKVAVQHEFVTRHQYNNSDTGYVGNTDYTPSVPDNISAYWMYNKDWYQGDKVTWYLHGCFYPNTGATNDGMRLYNVTDAEEIASSRCEWDSTDDTYAFTDRVSAGFAMPDSADGDQIRFELKHNAGGTMYFESNALVAVIENPTSVPCTFCMGYWQDGWFFDYERLPKRRIKVNTSAYSGDQVVAYIMSDAWDYNNGGTNTVALHDQGTSDSSDSANPLTAAVDPTSEVQHHQTYISQDIYGEFTDGYRYIAGGDGTTGDDIGFGFINLIILVRDGNYKSSRRVGYSEDSRNDSDTAWLGRPGTYGVARDFSSLSNWEVDNDRNLTTDLKSAVLECYDDASSFDDNALLYSVTSSSSYFRIIRAASGEGHNGTPDVGVTFDYTTDHEDGTFRCNEQYSSIQDLIIKLTISSSSDRYTLHYDENYAVCSYSTVVGCFIKGTNSGSGTAHGMSFRGNTNVDA